MYMKFYVYHVTNPDQVVNGTEKPFVIEKGPYAYREARSKIHNNFTEESTFVTYGQVKTYHFDKEKSCKNCNKDDQVKSHYIEVAQYYGTEYEIWADFGPVGNTEKKFWADYEQLLRAVFSCFQEENGILSPKLF